MTIEKLKVATKYNSTQQLLEKYGGESPKPATPKGEKKPKTPKQNAPPPVQRTGLPPPPTANIRRPPQPPLEAPNHPSSPPPYQNVPQQPPSPNGPFPVPQQPIDEPGFAPNAFPSSGQSGQYIEQPHWYDRLLDVLLGEDEMQPRNRMAMICGTCRLVNGQAPPGIKTPEELGRWRCGSCGAWNGVESETNQMLSTLRQEVAAEGSQGPGPAVGGEFQSQPSEAEEAAEMSPSTEEEPSNESEVSAEEKEEEHDESAESEEPKAEPVRRSKRGKSKQ